MMSTDDRDRLALLVLLASDPVMVLFLTDAEIALVPEGVATAQARLEKRARNDEVTQ